MGTLILLSVMVIAGVIAAIVYEIHKSPDNDNVTHL
jgi:hypothetical protein